MAGTERKLTENSRFLIHNPWGNGEGDAAYFRRYANELADEQARLLNFYKQQTGASTQLLQSYMTAEKLMSPELAVQLNFATGIIDTLKAMALYRNNQHNTYPTVRQNETPSPAEGRVRLPNKAFSPDKVNPRPTNEPNANRTLSPGEGRVRLTNQQIKHNMDKAKKNNFSRLIAGLKNLVKDFNNGAPDASAAAKTLAGDDGDLYFDGELAEGTAVFSDEAMTIPAADGDYQFEDGSAITVASGLITAVTETSDATGTTDDPAGRAVLAQLRKKLAALKAEKHELETALSESETVMASASKALQLARSTYRPDKRENKFNRTNKPTGTELIDKMEARRAELKAKKAV